MSKIRRQPRAVLIAQAVVIPIAVAVFGGLGAWLMARGERGAALTLLVVAALGPLSIGLYYGLSRLARSRAALDAVVLKEPPETVLRRVTDALQTLAPDVAPVVNRETLSVSTTLPVNWKTGGESIVATVMPADGGSMVNLSSSSLRDQLIDFGKNRENVDRILRYLRERDAGFD